MSIKDNLTLTFDEFLDRIVSGTFVCGIKVETVISRRIFVTIYYNTGDMQTCGIEFVRGESRRILIWIANFNFHIAKDGI